MYLMTDAVFLRVCISRLGMWCDMWRCFGDRSGMRRHSRMECLRSGMIVWCCNFGQHTERRTRLQYQMLCCCYAVPAIHSGYPEFDMRTKEENLTCCANCTTLVSCGAVEPPPRLARRSSGSIFSTVRSVLQAKPIACLSTRTSAIFSRIALGTFPLFGGPENLVGDEEKISVQ
jgi:hypothetical protein